MGGVDIPEMRIGDAERDEAVSRLREHYAAGRLTAAEFEDRMSTAMAAHTRSELMPLFTDLPSDPDSRLFTPKRDEVGPGSAVESRVAAPVPAGVNRPARRGMEIAVALAWPAAIIAIMAGAPWWLILIPIFLLPALRSGLFDNPEQREARDHRHELRRQEREDRHELRRNEWNERHGDHRGHHQQ